MSGAVDHEFDENTVDYADRVADALADVRTEPVPGSLAIDVVKRQVLFVRERVVNDLAEYYEQGGFDLATYGPHPFLPGVTLENAVDEYYYVNDLALEELSELDSRRDYDFPSGRLAVVPIEQAWRDAEVGDV